MKTEIKENSSPTEINESLTNVKKLKQVRPNIDHLIKKIVTARRKQEKKNIILIIAILVIASGIVLSSF
tara:strand:+ start:577 stop:783 length:207 start_codon:yes stop_codon:yes gene_type:complete